MHVYFFFNDNLKKIKIIIKSKKALKVNFFFKKNILNEWPRRKKEKAIFSIFWPCCALKEQPVRHLSGSTWIMNLVSTWFWTGILWCSMLISVNWIPLVATDHAWSAWRLLKTNDHQITFIKNKNINLMCSWSLT